MNKLSLAVLLFITLFAIGLTSSFAAVLAQAQAYDIEIYSFFATRNTPLPPTPTPTETRPPIATAMPTVTQTLTPAPPTATPTLTNTRVLPTNTPILPTAIPTQTNPPAPLRTRTHTPPPPTAIPTKTNTPILLTTIPTPTQTAAPPTAIQAQTSTLTSTPVPPTAISTRTQTPTLPVTLPTQTNTPPTTTPNQTLTPGSPTPTNTSVPNPTPVGGPGGVWNLKFSDEFNGAALDTTKWNTCYPEGCAHIGNNELECYMPDEVLPGSGILRLRARIRTVTCSNAVTYNYTSGMITSYNKYSLTYGYIEARTRGTSGQGMWPALWTIPADRSWPPELDILEILGNEPTRAYFTYHWGTPANRQQSALSWVGPNFSAGWHTFGVYWGPDAIRWYVDGVERRTAFTQTGNITSQPMYFLANLAVGGDWPGPPNGSTVFPNYFDLDYVRIWQR